MPKVIDSLYAFIAIDSDGDEGIMAFKSKSDMFLPMIGADLERVEFLKKIADEIQEHTDIKYEIRYFTQSSITIN